MIPRWLYYAICLGIFNAVVLLIARFVRRRRAGREETGRTAEAPVGESAQVPVAQVPVSVTSSEQPVVTTSRAAKRTRAAGDIREVKPRVLTKQPVPTLAYATAGGTSRPVSWAERRLFSGGGQNADEPFDHLPRVEPDAVPHADTGDFVFGRLTGVLAALLPESATRREQLKGELRTAGFYGPHAWHNLAAFRYLGIMLPLVLFGTLLVLVPPQLEVAVLSLLVLASGMGWALPRLYVKSKAARRCLEIESALPDMLDMLNMCVSQGLTVTNALGRISEELRSVYPALAQELSIVCEQSEMGTLEHALQNFADRIDIPEVHSFTSLMIQTDRMGTSVSSALTDYADNIREGLKQRADEKANKAAFKLLFPTVLCLMPAVYLILLGPAVIELSDFFHGGGRDAVDAGRQAIEQINNQ